MIEPEQLEKIRTLATSMVLCSRNKLIEDLLAELPLTERLFQRGLRMLEDNYAHDEILWDEAKAKVLLEVKCKE